MLRYDETEVRLSIESEKRKSRIMEPGKMNMRNSVKRLEALSFLLSFRIVKSLCSSEASMSLWCV